ncbi:hypothetical protein BGX28_006310 [Mortierella sp. GBA30]|nr:hypothetical protein BGX28_006310 [Mortierella sp. GBA30]
MTTTHYAHGSVNTPLLQQGHAHAHTTKAVAAVDRSEDINRKDSYGTNALHRAVVSNELGMVKGLLEHPKIDVNDKDLESGWTPLHWALYLGHLRIALVLIQHKNINLAVEDKDRNTALDLCMTTLPVSLKTGPCPADTLYTWGSNSNFTLGHNDGDDRKMPELVRFPYQTNTITFPRARSARPVLYQLSMSKFHTAIATSETGMTAKLWGFGTNGRIGSDRKMQLRPAPVAGIPGNVVTTAVGRDHTVLVTAKGEVFTLGNNKYGQLGYAMDIPKNGQDPIQYSPKKVILNVAKVKIIGAAASKWHTVVHSETELFTFGFNYGQLGYERKGDIQLGPRKVASTPPGLIIQVQASDSATACLMSSNDVVVFHKYAYHRVNFSLWPYPDWFGTVNLPTVLNENRPRKISCSENNFGMMTGYGDIHVWSYSEVDSDITLGSLPPNHSIPFSSAGGPEKPRRVWAYGGDRTHAIDFALGHNGSVIVLTRGGHVYIGTNKGNSIGRNVKWQRIPHLDRIVQVYANPSGAWAALRSESTLTPVVVHPGSLGSDFEQSLSQFHLYQNNEKNYGRSSEIKVDDNEDDDEDDVRTTPDPWRINAQGWQDIERSWDHDLVPLLDLTTKADNNTERSVSGSHLFDVELQAGKRALGGHRIILALRSPVFYRAFVESPTSGTTVGSLVTIEPNGRRNGPPTRILYTISLKVEFATAVLLLQFLYSDRFDPFWDALDLPKSNKQHALKVRQELYHLAMDLSLPTLQAALQYSFTPICSASLFKNMDQVIRDPVRFKSLADVRLLLKDGVSMDAHQVVLGHRSPFFNAMFVRTDEWIRARQGSRSLPGPAVEDRHSMLEVNMKHLDQESLMLTMKYIYTDCGPELFNDTEKDEMDDLIQVVVNVLRIADEWLMDRLKEICESVLGEQVRAKTVVYFLEISLMYSAESLKTTCIDYLCHNIEMALDQRWLEGVEDDVLVLVENALKAKQDAYMPVVRSGRCLPDAAEVEKMCEKIQSEGYRYFKPLETFKSDVAKAPHIRPNQAPEADLGYVAQRSPSMITLTENTIPPTPTSSCSISTPTHSISSLHEEPLLPVKSARNEAGLPAPKMERSSSASKAPEWPSLSEPPIVEARDITVLPRRKTSWEQIPTLGGLQLQHDDMDSSTTEGALPKPSLREILEQEQRQGHASNTSKTPSMTAIAVSPTKVSKLSQKERRKLLHQQQSSSTQDLAQLPQSAPQAWGKVPSLTATDLGVTIPVDGPDSLRRDSLTSNAGSTSAGTPSLLDIQQNELALFRVQPKEVPRVAIATSKPVKETMRPSGSEKSFSEAPWRLDAIPEPLRAVTRRQSQMYPKLEVATATSSGFVHGTSSRGPTSSTSFGASRSALPFNPHVNVSQANIDTPNSGGSPALTPTALSTAGMSILAPAAVGTSSSPSIPSSSSLSSFAIIQNQQLRDRNMLLRARHHKKSLYQIQIEEQALNQIRMMNLERVQAKETGGSGEWFTCEIGIRC